ncbi:hypothetical protein ABEF95_009246 [Exophiala dermatitidis]
MQPILRLAARAPRVPRQFPALGSVAQPARFAHQSYGNEQSGMQQGTHEKNPKVDMEHPGPEAPASKGTAKPSSSSSSSSSKPSSQSTSTSTSEGQSQGTPQTTSQGGSPAIHRPKSAAEKEDPEVKKHNEEMEQRSERTVNQLSEEDNKVDKRYWKGDVGPKDPKELPENVGKK